MTTYYTEHIEPPWPSQRIRRWLRKRRARWCADGLSPGSALEIGCGDGHLLATLQTLGWQVVGTERSEGRARRARELGLDVHIGDIRHYNPVPSSLDLVILWHTVEHLHDPLATLTEVRRLIRPSGRLVIGTPNAGSWQARMAGDRWYHLDLPRHLYHFDPATLEALLGHAGFRIDTWSCGGLSYEFRGWWELVGGGTSSRSARYLLASLPALALTAVSAAAGRSKRRAAMAVQATPVVN